MSEKNIEQLKNSSMDNTVQQVEESIHIKCNDAYEGDAGKDDGSELALWHQIDGGLLATIFFNDISAKAYGSASYNFSFNPDQANQIKIFLTTTSQDQKEFESAAQDVQAELNMVNDLLLRILGETQTEYADKLKLNSIKKLVTDYLEASYSLKTKL